MSCHPNFVKQVFAPAFPDLTGANCIKGRVCLMFASPEAAATAERGQKEVRGVQFQARSIGKRRVLLKGDPLKVLAEAYAEALKPHGVETVFSRGQCLLAKPSPSETPTAPSRHIVADGKPLCSLYVATTGKGIPSYSCPSFENIFFRSFSPFNGSCSFL